MLLLAQADLQSLGQTESRRLINKVRRMELSEHVMGEKRIFLLARIVKRSALFVGFISFCLRSSETNSHGALKIYLLIQSTRKAFHSSLCVRQIFRFARPRLARASERQKGKSVIRFMGFCLSHAKCLSQQQCEKTGKQKVNLMLEKMNWIQFCIFFKSSIVTSAA